MFSFNFIDQTYFDTEEYSNTFVLKNFTNFYIIYSSNSHFYKIMYLQRNHCKNLKRHYT